MSSKLDQSLDDILVERKKTTGRRGRGRRVVSGRRVTRAAPSGGIQKKAAAGNTTTKTVVPVAPAPLSGESKIIVSGLPSDVTEQQIKEYFVKSIGPIKKVFLTYGPNGVSRGVSTIVFNKPDSAGKALAQLNGVKVDNKAMRIEIVVNSANAQATAPQKGLGDRVQAKNQPKSAAPKPATNGTSTTRGAKRGRGRRARNPGRKPKTADELDADMMDYFDATGQDGTNVPANASASNGVVQPAAGGEDLEIS